MKIIDVRVTEWDDDEVRNEYPFCADQTKSVYENALIALNEVIENEYFAEAEIFSPDNPDIYTSKNFPGFFAENEKEYLYCWWGINYAAGVEISILVEE